MSYQSLSVVVPTGHKCINSCKFCVSRMREDRYVDQIVENKRFFDLYLRDYLKRLEFARDNGCQTIVLTGSSEPQQNMSFLTNFGMFMMLLDKPFRNIEMQTTGVMLDEQYLRFLRNHVGVNTIALSISSLINRENQRYNGTVDKLAVNIDHLCEKIKCYDFNLRLSINMTDAFCGWEPHQLLAQARNLGANQVTFRLLFNKGYEDTEPGRWIKKHALSKDHVKEIEQFIVENGTPIERLPFGAMRYSIMGMSVVVDNDCMNKEVKEEQKYLILRPDCHLYTQWDDPASLVF